MPLKEVKVNMVKEYANGTYGIIHQAILISTGEMVAVKLPNLKNKSLPSFNTHGVIKELLNMKYEACN